MTRLLIAVAAGLAFASPAFALSVTTTAAAPQAAAKFTDPDEALSGLAKLVAGSTGQTERQTPEPRGAMVTYDLSAGAKQASSRDGLADLAAQPGNPDYNPFSGGGLEQGGAARSH